MYRLLPPSQPHQLRPAESALTLETLEVTLKQPPEVAVVEERVAHAEGAEVFLTRLLAPRLRLH